MLLTAGTALAWASRALAMTHVDFATGYSGQPDSPYNYPSPNMTHHGAWQVALAKAKRFIAELTLEEKVGICTGGSLSK